MYIKKQHWPNFPTTNGLNFLKLYLSVFSDEAHLSWGKCKSTNMGGGCMDQPYVERKEKVRQNLMKLILYLGQI